MNSNRNNIYQEKISVSLEDIEYLSKLNKSTSSTNNINTPSMSKQKSISEKLDKNGSEKLLLNEKMIKSKFEDQYYHHSLKEMINKTESEAEVESINQKLSTSESTLALSPSALERKEIENHDYISPISPSTSSIISDKKKSNSEYSSPLTNENDDKQLPSRINTKENSDNESKSIMSSLQSPSNPNYDFFSESSSIPLSTPFYQTNLCNEGDERADAVVELLKIKPYQDALSIIIRHVVSRRTWSSQLEYKQHLLAKEFHELVCEIPSWVDWDRIDHGQKVFWRYSWPLWISCIGSAMTRGATLPIPSPNDGKTPNQRLLETSQFLLECMYPDSLKPGNFGWSTAIRIRCAHALSRSIYLKSLKENNINNDFNNSIDNGNKINSINNNNSNVNNENNSEYNHKNTSFNNTNFNGNNNNNNNSPNDYQDMIPVSQADLIRTILYISLGSISAMKRAFGIRMDKTEKEDYVLLWRYISWLCGVDNQNNPLISVREGENATNQLIAAESCMFLDDEAVQFTSAMLQAMASTIPLLGRTTFVRAMTNEMARRLMGNEVVTNMKLKPKSNETHRQILKWIIQCCRFSCRVIAKNAFGKSLLCSFNRIVVSKMVWLANGGKWVDYSRGCYSGVIDDETVTTTTAATQEENDKEISKSNSPTFSNNNNVSNNNNNTSTAIKRLSFLSERDEYFSSHSASMTSEIASINRSNSGRSRRRSQIHSIDSTLVNEYNSIYTYGEEIERERERERRVEEEDDDDEEWLQKPISTYSLLIHQHSKRHSNHVRPLSWTSNEFAKNFENQNENNISSHGNGNGHVNGNNGNCISNSNSSSSSSIARRYSYVENNNPFSTKKVTAAHWIERMARINMWAVVPAMSVAMAAYCVVLVYID